MKVVIIQRETTNKIVATHFIRDDMEIPVDLKEKCKAAGFKFHVLTPLPLPPNRSLREELEFWCEE